jgi:hypothetical protein
MGSILATGPKVPAGRRWIFKGEVITLFIGLVLELIDCVMEDENHRRPETELTKALEGIG